jgi:excisionase family DNA binding protein
MPNSYYTPSQAARILQLSRRRVTQMLNNGQLEGSQLENGRWRMPAEAIIALLSARSSARSRP